jgi:hypothetical protein
LSFPAPSLEASEIESEESFEPGAGRQSRAGVHGDRLGGGDVEVDVERLLDAELQRRHVEGRPRVSLGRFEGICLDLDVGVLQRRPRLPVQGDRVVRREEDRLALALEVLHQVADVLAAHRVHAVGRLVGVSMRV